MCSIIKGEFLTHFYNYAQVQLKSNHTVQILNTQQITQNHRAKLKQLMQHKHSNTTSSVFIIVFYVLYTLLLSKQKMCALVCVRVVCTQKCIYTIFLFFVLLPICAIRQASADSLYQTKQFGWIETHRAYDFW